MSFDLSVRSAGACAVALGAVALAACGGGSSHIVAAHNGTKNSASGGAAQTGASSNGRNTRSSAPSAKHLGGSTEDRKAGATDGDGTTKPRGFRTGGAPRHSEYKRSSGGAGGRTLTPQHPKATARKRPAFNPRTSPAGASKRRSKRPSAPASRSCETFRSRFAGFAKKGEAPLLAKTAGQADAAFRRLEATIGGLESAARTVGGTVKAAKGAAKRLQATLKHLHLILLKTGPTGNYTVVFGPVEHVVEAADSLEALCGRR